MGCSATLTLSFGFRISPLCPPSSSSTRSSHASIKLASFNNKLSSLRLSSSNSISGFGSFFPHNNNLCTIPQRPRSLTIVSAKGYKMKTHKVPSSLSLSLGLCVCVCVCELGFQMSRHCHLQTKFGSTRLNPVQNFEFILS